MRPNVRAANLKGENGGTFIDDTAAHVPPAGVPCFESFQAITACVIDEMASNLAGNATAGMNIPAGEIIYAKITSIQLTSGTGIAYNVN